MGPPGELSRGLPDTEEPTWLQRYVIAPARFLLFILSLALIAQKDDRERPSGYRKSRTRTRTRRSGSTGGSGSDPGNEDRSRSTSKPTRVLHSFQRKLGVMELKTAFLAEEFLTALLFRSLLIGSAAVLLLYVRSCLSDPGV